MYINTSSKNYEESNEDHESDEEVAIENSDNEELRLYSVPAQHDDH
jgi:hypothetical protein